MDVTEWIEVRVMRRHALLLAARSDRWQKGAWVSRVCSLSSLGERKQKTRVEVVEVVEGPVRCHRGGVIKFQSLCVRGVWAELRAWVWVCGCVRACES